MAGSAGYPLAELREHRWAPLEIAPTALDEIDYGVAMINDERIGGVVVLDLRYRSAWVRAGSRWTRLPGLPVAMLGASTAYDPVTGRVMLIGETSRGERLAAILSWTSPTPFESCRPGEDRDGDGLAGCDDPDCYWACSGPLPYTAAP
jgi:hypothetical protein